MTIANPFIRLLNMPLVAPIITQVHQIRCCSNQMLVQGVLLLQGLRSLKSSVNATGITMRTYALEGDLHLKPIQENSQTQEAKGIPSLNMAHKNGLKNDRQNKQGQNMSPSKSRNPFGFNPRSLSFRFCLTHHLWSFPHDHLKTAYHAFSEKQMRECLVSGSQFLEQTS